MGDGSVLLRIKFYKINDSSVSASEQWGYFKSIKIGDSIAINGICLTATKIDASDKIIDFFVSHETIAKTTVLTMQKGMKVHAELAMLASDRLGGHILTGHIDEVITLSSVRELGNSLVLKFTTSPKGGYFLIPKGSVAIDGVSLTINSVFKNTFEVCIIPHTWQNTTLNQLDVSHNNLCNCEFDYFAKIINKNIRQLGLKISKN